MGSQRRWTRRGARWVPIALTMAFVASNLLVSQAPASAAGIIVANGSDLVAVDGACSLREAITAANSDSPVNECPAGSGSDTITFPFDLTISLTSRLPVITSDIVIDGSGANIVIDGQTTNGNDGTSILRVNQGGSLVLDNLTVTRGRTQTCSFGGGTDSCGAVLNYGSLDVIDSTFSNHQGNGFANGIAITSRQGTLIVDRSTFVNNRAVSSGAIWNASQTQTGDLLTTATISNSTFSGNTGGNGGAIYNTWNAQTTVLNSTFVDTTANQTLNNAGGASASLTVRNSIVIAASGSPGVACGQGTTFASSTTLDTDGTCGTSATLASLDLQPLADNGGPTETVALGSSSVAIDAGDNVICAAAPVGNVDQRGVARPGGASCDIGAFEVDPTSISHTFTGPGTSWSNPANWDTNQVPDGNDTATIAIGPLDVDGTQEIGKLVIGAGVDVTITNLSSLTITDTGGANGQADSSIVGNLNVAAGGTFVIDRAFSDVQIDGTVDIADGGLVELRGGSDQLSGSTLAGSGNIQNAGTLLVTFGSVVSLGSLNLTSAVTSNLSAINGNGGTLSINANYAELGTMSVGPNGSIAVYGDFVADAAATIEVDVSAGQPYGSVTFNQVGVPVFNGATFRVNLISAWDGRRGFAPTPLICRDCGTYDLTLDIGPEFAPYLGPTAEVPARDGIRLASAIEPIAHWTFDEANSGPGTGFVTDEAGGPDAAISGAAEYIPGVVGAGALSFDGVDDFIDAGLRPDLDLLGEAYTIAFWIQSPDPVGTGTVERVVSMDFADDVDGGYSVLAGQGDLCCRFTHNTGAANDTVATFLDDFDADWTHVAIVYEGNTFFNNTPQLTFYYDGIERGTFPVAGDLTTRGTDPLVIGAIRPGAPIQFLDGNLDDLRLYDDLLYPNEIAALAAPVSTAGPTPTIDYAVTTGGATVDVANDVTVDPFGNVTTVGFFSGSNVDFDPGAGTDVRSSQGADDGYVYQLDANGEFAWVGQFNSTSNVNATTVDTDGEGNVYVAGFFAGTVDLDPTPFTGAIRTSAGARDIFVVKLDAGGNHLWNRVISGPNDVGAPRIDVSPAGEIALASSYTGNIDLDPGLPTVSAPTANGQDSFVVRLDTNGDYVWGDTANSTTAVNLIVQDVAFDDAGDVYLAGYYSGSATVAGDVITTAGSTDGWIARYDSTGAGLWAGSIGGGAGDGVNSIAVTGDGNTIHVGGGFAGLADLDPGIGVATATAVTPLALGGDGVILRLDGSGDLVRASVFTGNAGIGVNAVRLSPDGGLVFNGGFFTGDLDLDPGPAELSFTANTGPFDTYGDVFVGKLDATGALEWGGQMGGNDLDQFLQRGLDVDNAGNAYIAGWFWQTADFDPGAAILNRTSNGSGDGFLVKLGTAGLPSAGNLSFDVRDDSGTPGVTQVGVGAVNILDIPIESIVGANGASYQSAPLGSIPLGSIPLGSIDLAASPLGSIPLGSIPLGSIDLAASPLGSIPLGSIPLGSIGGWGEVLVGTALEDKPLQAVTLTEVLALDPLPSGVAAISLSDIGVEGSPLGSIGLPSIALGDQELLAIDPTLCDGLTDPSICTDPATDTLLELQLASAPLGSIPLGSIPLGSIPLGSIPLGSIPLGSIPLGSIPLGSIPLGSINLDTAPLGSIPLGSIDLQGAPLGSIPLGSIPLESIDGFVCPDCETLALDPTNSTIAEYIDARGTTIDASPLGSIPLGSIPLGSIPLGSIPLGSIPLGSIDLLGAPLGSIPLGSIPLGSIPLGSIDLDAAPLGSIPLGSIPLGSIPLGSIPLGSIGELGGCAALSPSSVDCDALNLTDASSAVEFVNALPAGMTLASFIEELPVGTTISDTPLGSIPLGSIPLGSIPLGSIPLGSIPLGSIGLDAASLARSPLGSIPLGSIPLGSIPLGSIGDGGGCVALAPSAVDCNALGLSDGSSIVDYVNALPTGMTMNLFLAALPVGTTIADSPLGSIPLGSIPLGSIPLGSIDLQAVEVKGAPLGSIPLGSIGLNGAGVAASPLGSIPLGSIDLDASPLGSIPLGSIPLGSIPLGSIPLGSIPLGSIPLGSIPLGSIPLGSIDAVVDCGAVDCLTATLGDAAAAGALRPGATLADVGEYGSTTLGQLGTYGSATLGELGEYGDTTLGDLSTYGPSIFGGMTLGQLDDLLTLDLLYGEGTLGTPGNDYGDLNFGQVLVSMLLASDFPWETLPLADLGLQSIAPTGTVTYSTSFDLSGPGSDAIAAQVTAGVPADFFVQPGSAMLVTDGVPSPIADGESVLAGGEPAIRFDLALESGHTYAVEFDAVPGFATGVTTTTSSLTLAAPVVGIAADGATLTVEEYFDGNNDFASATAVTGDTLVFSHISAARTSDYFRFEPGPVGTRHAVFVSQFDIDADVVLYKPATEQISEVEPRAVPLDSTPIADDGVDYAGGETQQPALQGDIDIQSAPIGDVSINRGTTAESAESTLASAPVSATDPYVIQVSGYQGEASSSPYVVRVKKEQVVSAPACPAISFPNAAASGIDLNSLPADLNTVFLFNHERTAYQYGLAAADDIAASLDALIADGANGVIGAVVALEDDFDTQAAYAAWDADPCDTDAANAVVGAITGLLAEIRTLHPTLGYVTIVGNDDMVPFARIDDVTSIANESTFTEQFGDGALLGALATRHYLSDDPYGDIDPIRWLDRRLHMPELALGRLVESPADIAAALDTFVTFDGQLDPQTAAVAGYDFLADGTTVILDRLTNIYGPAFTEALIDAAGTAAVETWTLSDLLSFLDLSDATPGSDTADIISINAHSDQYRQLPSYGDASSDESELFEVTDISNLPADSLIGSIVFTMGCHAGLSVSDVSVDTANDADWAQTYAAQGAIYVANSGYGYGDTVSVALSERLMAEFAENLDGGMTVGQAMAFAKQEYFAQLGQYGPYDEKAMQQVIVYGLPMYAIGTTPPPAPPTPLPTALYPSLNLEAATVGITPVYETTTGGDGTYLSIDGLTQNTQFRPIQPVQTVDITQDPSELLAHGAIITDATTTDTGSFDPVYFRPNITGATEREPEAPSDEISTEIFDVNIATYNAPGVGPNGEPFTQRQQATIIAGSFRSPADGDEIGVQTTIDTADLAVFYADPSSSDFDAPHIADVDSTVVDGQVSFTVSTDATDVAAAIVLYRQQVTGAVSNWTSVTLLPEAGGTTFTGGGAVDPSAVVGGGVDYKVWLVDTSGNVSSSDAKNELWQALPPPPPEVPTELSLTVPTPTIGSWFTGDVTVPFIGEPEVTYTVTGADTLTIEGAGNIVISADGVNEVTVEGGGLTATFVVLIDTTPPAPASTSVATGDEIPQGVPSTFEFDCTDAGAGITEGGCTAEIGISPLAAGDGTPFVSGGPIDTSTPDTTYDVIITSTDDVGKVTVTTVTFTVAGLVEFAPSITVVDAPTTPQLITDGVFIDIEFDDENGTLDDYTVTVDWGNLDENETPGSADTCVADTGAPTDNGSTSCAIVAEPSGTGAGDGVAVAEFVYDAPGVYPVTVTITDSSGHSVEYVYEFVVVYDPGAGRVSGAGFYSSGPEAYPGGPASDTPAFFGYHNRYRDGEVVPTGPTKLRLGREFFFKSTANDYLIINDTMAVTEGVGKFNGQNGYRFRVQAIDMGRVDFFQITIWDPDGLTVYDNGVLWAPDGDPDGDLVLLGGIRIRS